MSRPGPLMSIAALLAACSPDPSLPNDCAFAAEDAWSPAAPPTWVELWRAGGAGSNVELAMPMAVNVAPDGRLAIPDFRLGLAGVSARGEWLGSLTTPGEGPGEVAMPFAAAWADDGSLSILDFGSARVVILGPDGRLTREFRIDGEPLAAAARSGSLSGLAMTANGTVYLLSDEPSGADGTLERSVLRLPADGSPADTVVSRTTPSLATVWEGGAHIQAPGWPRLTFAVTPDGRLAYAGHGDSYGVEVVDPDGSSRSLCRVVDPLPLRPDEVELDDPTGDFADHARALADAPRPDTPAPISRLLLGRGGRLWVERERFGTGDAMASFIGRSGSLFDVFDPAGAYLGEIHAPEGVHVVAVDGDRVWGLEYDEFDAPVVIAYRLERRDRAGGGTDGRPRPVRLFERGPGD